MFFCLLCPVSDEDDILASVFSISDQTSKIYDVIKTKIPKLTLGRSYYLKGSLQKPKPAHISAEIKLVKFWDAVAIIFFEKLMTSCV